MPALRAAVVVHRRLFARIVKQTRCVRAARRAPLDRHREPTAYLNHIAGMTRNTSGSGGRQTVRAGSSLTFPRAGGSRVTNGTRADCLAARDGPLPATRATTPRHDHRLPLDRRLGDGRADGAAEGTLRRHTKRDRSLGHWEAGIVSHRLRSYLLPFSVVAMIDVDASARLQQAVRNGQRGVACGLRCDGRLADEIAGLDDGCR